MENSSKKYNQEQLAAVTHTDGPLLIVAGAGTGKTTALVGRLENLIKEKLARPDEILLLTFTEKATEEMEDRALKILPYGCVDLWINTFHKFCERTLRDFALDIGLDSGFKLLTETDQWILIKKNINKFDLDYYKPLGNPNKFIFELIKHFSRLKDEDIAPAQYLEYADSLRENQDAMLSGARKSTKSQITNSKQISNSKFQFSKKSKSSKLAANSSVVSDEEIKRINELANAYHVYNQLLLEEGYLDFGDLICYTLRLFRERKNILKYYQEKFKYIMVDEFQDTNWAQYELLKMLAGDKKNLLVVGDDDQCLPGSSMVLTKSGKKRIDKIKTGEEVATAVGKGYLSYSKVNYVNISEDKKRLLTFVTENNNQVTVTDNHKLFCMIPQSGYMNSKIKNKFYYVYLMYKDSLGWRIGITGNLVTRLRLERTADKLVAINVFHSEEEARYWETFYSLKYGIPTVCFKERNGVLDQEKWSKKLYNDLDIESSVKQIVKDLKINIDEHHFCLNAVKRGGKTRIKINLEMCHRNYRSKYAKAGYLQTPQVIHLLSLETSDHDVIGKIEKLGLKMTKAKVGKRLRISSSDLKYLGRIALKIQKATGGVIENFCNVGKVEYQHKKALIISAGNILPGMYLPIVANGGIKYEQIISRQETEKKIKVYDLEIEKTHNFVADNVVVHNSIYKFRGASLSNIMQFKDDFPGTKEVILNKNYRSGQVILDCAYDFIKHNDPNRLEVKLEIDKKLLAQKKESGQVEFINFETEQDESGWITDYILAEYNKNKEAKWSDFAILVRANSTAGQYVKALTAKNIPNLFVSQKGLYYKPIILDCLSYLKLLDNYHESSALFRVLNMEVFKVDHATLITINKFARQKAWSLYEALYNINVIPGIDPGAVANVNKLLALVRNHSRMAQTEKTSKLFVQFVWDAELNKKDHNQFAEYYSYLNQFYQKIKRFEEANEDARLKDFVDLMSMEMEAGEEGALRLDYEDDDVVKVMTVHAAKGLEFDYVFLPNLVDKRFPTINRAEKIRIPDEIVKEKLPEGKDVHIEEERRLFYVALTRAKKYLYLTSAKDCGGARDKKPSPFIAETGVAQVEKMITKRNHKNDLLNDLENINVEVVKDDKKLALPTRFSFSQIEGYSKCPLQYKFNFILRIPVPQKSVFVFGRVMHDTLRKFLEPLEDGREQQLGLFGNTGIDKTKQRLTEKDLLKIYEDNWQDDWYNTRQEREDYKKRGRESLKLFYADLENNGWPSVMFLEKNFSHKFGDYFFKGAIDRVDRLPDGTVEIIDYKTGSPKEKLDYQAKRQLILYKIVMEESFGLKVSKLSFYYLENGTKATFEADDKIMEKLKLEIIDAVKEIRKGEFLPNPGMMCEFCDFRDICEFRKT